LRLRRRSKRKAPPRVSVRSAGGLERRQLTTRIHLPLSSRDTGRESLPRHRRSRNVSGPTATSGTPSKLVGGLRASTKTTTTACATTTIGGAGGATTAMTTASAAGHRTSGVHGLLAGASVTRSSPRASGFRPMCRDAKFPSCFRVPTNVPRYDEDTNPSVWLEDYRLACHAGC
jgi:hypothetical protein